MCTHQYQKHLILKLKLKETNVRILYYFPTIKKYKIIKKFHKNNLIWTDPQQCHNKKYKFNKKSNNNLNLFSNYKINKNKQLLKVEFLLYQFGEQISNYNKEK